jgi:hypothetical protein
MPACVFSRESLAQPSTYFAADPAACPGLVRSIQNIFPRRKRRKASALDSDSSNTRHDPRLAVPVVVTMELVAHLAALSLVQAAATIGISATALKRACRRLGIARWPLCKRAEAPAAAAEDGVRAAVGDSETACQGSEGKRGGTASGGHQVSGEE